LLALKSTSRRNWRYFPFPTIQIYAPSCFHLFHQAIISPARSVHGDTHLQLVVT